MLAFSPVLLSGRCTITEVPGQRDRVTEAISTGDGAVVLDLSGVETADVTFVQLLAAALAEALRRGRAFAVVAWSVEAETAVTRAGFSLADFPPSSVSGA